MIADLFSGIEGWGEGLRALGLDAIGIEVDRDAALTARAAGHTVIRADVTTLDTARFAGLVGLVGSPPCQTFSRAGSREGMNLLPALVGHVHACAELGWHPWEPVEYDADPRTGLVLEPLRFVADCRPEWVALEQVPDVLAVWRAYARTLSAWGYSTWAGVLCAADFGIPQTRHRAILMASRTRTVHPPPATHARAPQPSLFGPQLAPWVSMATALGWGLTGEPARTMVATSDDGGARPLDGGSGAREHIERERAAGRWLGFPRKNDRGEGEYRDRDWRPEDEPAFVVTEKARSWTVLETGQKRLPRSADEPAPTVAFGNDAASWVVNTGRDWKEGGDRAGAQRRPVHEPAPTLDAVGRWHVEEHWPHHRPATTIACDPRVGVPVHHRDAANPDAPRRTAGAVDAADVEAGEYDGKHAIRLEPSDALVLQGFPRDYPLQGNRTSRFRCIGNAWCPAMAEAVVRQLT